MTQLKIFAQVNSPTQKLSYTPLQVDFGDVLRGKKSKFKIELTNDDSTKSKIKIVDWPPSEYIKKTKLKKDKLKPGKSTNLEFELAEDSPTGLFETSISLEIEDKPGSRVTIPIKGSVISEKPKPKDQAKANE